VKHPWYLVVPTEQDFPGLARNGEAQLASSAEDAKSAWASWARRASVELRPEAVDCSLSGISARPSVLSE